MNFVFKVYHRTLGAHTHFRVFSGEKVTNEGRSSLRNYGCAGVFTMRQEEAQAFLGVLRRGSGDGGEVQIEEDK